MNEFLYTLKKIVAQVGDEAGINFRHYGVGDLMLELGSNPSPQRIAAISTRYLCTEDGEYTGFEPGLQVVLQFLSETCSSLPHSDIKVVARELIAFLQSRPNAQKLTAWFEKYYQ